MTDSPTSERYDITRASIFIIYIKYLYDFVLENLDKKKIKGKCREEISLISNANTQNCSVSRLICYRRKILLSHGALKYGVKCQMDSR